MPNQDFQNGNLSYASITQGPGHAQKIHRQLLDCQPALMNLHWVAEQIFFGALDEQHRLIRKRGVTRLQGWG